MPPAPESPGMGRDENQGVPVPHAPEPHATGHELEFGLATLRLGEPAPPGQGAVTTGDGGSTVAAHPISVAAPRRPLVVCQLPIGEGIGKPWVHRDNPQWKFVTSREQTARPPSGATTAAGDKAPAAKNPQLQPIVW